jgi:1-acyl-sn-glycerol-3-phosphate acyltransferase
MSRDDEQRVNARMWPLHGTAFWTTFGDHMLRQMLVVHVMRWGGDVLGLDRSMFLGWSVLILLAPFVFMAPLGGWLSARFDARRMLRLSQVFGVLVLAAGGVAIAQREYEVACLCLALKGLQSSFVGASKYGVLAGLAGDERGLMRGNAWFESLALMGIFLGTLGGLFFGEFSFSLGYDVREPALAMGLAITSILGLVLSFIVPKAKQIQTGKANSPEKTSGFLGALRREEGALLSAMGVAWFWFLGAALFTIGPIYVGQVFEGDSEGFLFLFGVFGAGLVAGTMICRWMAKGLIELGLVPFASLGISVLLVDLCIIGYPEELLSLGTIWGSWTGMRLMVDLFALACFGGVFTLPLQSFIQRALNPGEVAKAAASVNWLSAMLMCVAGVLVVAMWSQGMGARWIFLTLAVMNFVVMLFVYHMLPRFVWSFMVWVLTQVMYTYTMSYREKIPMEGAAVISCNHPSFVDFMFVAAALSHRPPRFIMHHTFFKMPVVGWLFRDLDIIPIAPRSEDEGIMQEAFDEVARTLEAGELVCIFPEGLVTFDGKLNAFRPGIEKIVTRTPVPVIPMALTGLWGSFFSRDHAGQKAMKEPFRKFKGEIELIVGDPIPAEGFTARKLGEITAQMGGWEPPREVNSPEDRALQEKSKES